VVIDGIRFASKVEGRRYLELKALERAGQIAGLKRQPRFPFDIDGERMFTYYADYEYFDLVSKRRVIEDVKGVKPDVYKLKKKIIQKAYAVVITEVFYK
jgi:hypothetical protein